MRKLRNIFLAGAALPGLLSCAKELEHVIYNPSDSDLIAPVFNTIDNIEVELSESGAFGTAVFTEASFGLKATVNYALFADLNADFSSEVQVASVTNGTRMDIPGKALNAILLDDGIEPGTEAEVKFRIKAVLQGYGGAVGGSVQPLISNTLIAKAIPYSAEKEYPKVWVLGNFCSWSHDNAQHLFDFSDPAADEIYEGVVDFGEDVSALEFKLTGAAGWDNDTGNWGVADPNTPAESESIQLLNGSSDNITQYRTYRYIHWTLNKGTLVLTKNLGFDQVGVIGVGGDWENDIVMTFDKNKQRFYADVDAGSDTEFKFRLDAAWGHNWGGSLDALQSGGGNIPLSAGQYRIYFNMNDYDKMTCTIDPDMYGKEEGTEPEPQPEPSFEGWSLIGNGDWETDVDMVRSGDYWVVRGVELKAGEGFKFRKDHDWSSNYGGPGESEPYMVPVGEKFEAVSGGKNLAVAEAGAYDLYLNPEEPSIYVMEAGDVPGEIATWGIVGTLNGWGGSADLAMSEEDGIFVRRDVSLTASDEIKIRYRNDWDAGDYGASRAAVGEALQAVAKGGNIKVGADGDFDIYFDLYNEVIFIVNAGDALPDYWGVVGTINGWGDTRDRIMFEDGKGMYVFLGLELADSDEIKIRQNSAWSVDRGSGAAVVDAAFDVTQGGSNMKVPAGRYDLYYDAAHEQFYIMTAGKMPSSGGESGGPDEPETVYADYIYEVGTNTSWGDGEPVALRSGQDGGKNNGKYKGFAYLEGEFKFKPNADSWDGDWEYDGEGRIADNGGGNCPAPEAAGYYMIEVDLTAMTYQLTAVTTIGIVGPAQAGGWDADTDMTYNAEGGYWEAVAELAAEQFKFRANDDWAINWGAPGSDEPVPVTAGQAFDGVQGGKNYSVPEAGTYAVKLFALCDGKAYAEMTKQ